MLPNFIVVGAPRSGTTALHYSLQSHPDVTMSRTKEPNYFAFDNGQADIPWTLAEEVLEGFIERSVTDLDAYEALFEAAPAVGEASPFYLRCPGAPERIKHAIPDCKIIIILRQPVTRAYSDFMQRSRNKGEAERDDINAVFEQTLELQQARVAAGEPLSDLGLSPYVESGLYSASVSRYQALFEPLIIIHDELKENSAAVYASIFSYLGVDSSFSVAEQSYNASGVPKRAWVDKALRPNRVTRFAKTALPSGTLNRLGQLRHKLQNQNLKPTPNLTPDVKARLTNHYFTADIKKLEKVIVKDLSHWYC